MFVEQKQETKIIKELVFGPTIKKNLKVIDLYDTYFHLRF